MIRIGLLQPSPLKSFVLKTHDFVQICNSTTNKCGYLAFISSFISPSVFCHNKGYLKYLIKDIYLLNSYIVLKCSI